MLFHYGCNKFYSINPDELDSGKQAKSDLSGEPALPSKKKQNSAKHASLLRQNR
jgi:hypothetical protein